MQIAEIFRVNTLFRCRMMVALKHNDSHTPGVLSFITFTMRFIGFCDNLQLNVCVVNLQSDRISSKSLRFSNRL